MAEGNLKQAEIDHLLERIQGTSGFSAADFEDADNAVDKLAIAQKKINKAKTVRALADRLYFAMDMRSDPETIEEARRDLHSEAFGLWCANRGIDKNDYYSIIKKELKRRGLRYVSANPPGFKLVKIC